ncbi:amino acid adenylation domain-containing protein [Variovorax boronicumulans]|uniref:Amino acid adenylation domain-containing protein n=1 Tax=Variovorax boronicumulans TaxID=436515 RepID=A0AAW8D9V3_9BURK|nr:non-ribosomal peptide synthetase [Variovorax boronicumulans]MDP9897428.1 amino acid adenylation domain-containing protein [Variovorax boronicumulans]MDQ0057467.1 amino acid adenylation domain-containing protein [Variovorax boronicumulans]
MDTKKQEIAERFARLPADKQKAFLGLLAQQKIDFARLPIVKAQPERRRLLSYVQARQWFLWQLDPQSTAYHISGALELKGALDVAAVRASFEALVARHESLRTVFQVDAEAQVAQRIHEDGELDFVQIDLAADAAADREKARAAANEAARRIANTPFDLAQGPLLRVGLIRLAPETHVLVLVMHHIVSDGGSLRIVMDEFVAQYRACVQGEAAALQPLPIQYADYAVWQRNWLEAGERERQLAYWTTHVGRGQPVLQVPADRPRRTDGRYAAMHHGLVLPDSLVKALHKRAHAEGATLFMALLAGFQALLHRYTGQQDLRVGVPIANRHRPETAGVIGFFANTQVLRVAIDDRASLSQLLAQTREAALGAQMHQDLPFEQLVEALQPERILGTNPLFQVLFNHQRSGADVLKGLPGLALEEYALGGQAAQLELALETVEDAEGRVHASLRYAAELFDAATIERMAGHYLAVLQALADHPEQAVGDVDLLGAAERAQLAAWGSNPQRYPNETPVPQLIAQQAALRPDAVALVFGDQKLSYGELNVRANRLAHRLIALGVKPETKVGIAVERSNEMMVGLLGILKAGGAYVPLDPEYPVERLAFMVEASGIGLLLAQRHQTALVARLAFGTHKPAVLLVDDPGAMAQFGPDTDPQVELHGENLAYVIYTSGSTGKPKGVMVRHGAWSHLMASMRERPGMTADDVLVAVSSLSFDMASLELYLPLVCGARIVLAPRGVVRDGEALGRLIREQGVTVLQSTPAGWRLLEADFRAHGLPARFKALCGGEAMHPDLALSLRALGIELWNMYGPTEATVWVTADRVEREPRFGSAIAATQLHVLDGALNPTPPGVAGELYLGGVGLARGYLARAELTAERFVANPFDDGQGGRLYRTGDMVRWRGDGQLEYLGRTDHQVKVRGFRIELGEIETQLLAQPEVREAVVVAIEGPAGARLVGYVSAQPDRAIEVAALKDRLAEVLPDYMVPGTLVVLDALPLNPNGKVDRKALPEPELAQVQAYEAPEGEVEEKLAAIWAEVLGLPLVGRHDDFFEIGGHSLLAAQVASRVRVAYDVALPLRRLFEHPMLRALAAHVRETLLAAQQSGKQVPALRPVARTADMRLSPSQQRLWLVDRLFAASDAQGRAAYNVTAALRLSGALHVDAVRATLDAIMQRHEALRTSFPENEDGDPVARIAPRGDLVVALHDLSALPDDRKAAAVQEALAAHARTVFDLANGPVFAASMLQLAPREHMLLLCVHHIAFDGWSEAVFVRDFIAFYTALREGREAQLPPLAIQYADYADWQHRKLEATFDEQAAFWRGYLDGVPAVSTLVPDLARPKVASTAGDSVNLALPKALSDALGALARQHGTSLYTMLLAVFLLVLHRQSGRDDVVVGADVAGRNHPALEPLIGFFVGVVPLRSRLAPGTGFAQWLAGVKESTLSAFEHQDLSFEQIVELAGVPRSQQHNPLVQVLFVMQNMPASRFEIPGVTLESVPPPTIASKFDLAVFVTEGETELTVNWVYATSLYRRETIERASAAWRDLLQQVATSPTDALESFFISSSSSSLESKTMSSSTPALGKLQKLKKVVGKERGAAGSAPRSPIRMSFLSPAREFPLVIEATGSDLDPVAWARDQREFIEAKLRQHGGILLRNFGLETPQDFEAFAEMIEPELYGSYGDLPKKEGGKKTYRSTPYPERQMILYHNESSHMDRWPRKQWFFCELPSPVGGATPIVDCREMLRRLPAELVAEFERKELLYVRTFVPHFDVSWQEFFKTESRSEIEARLAAAGIAWRWLDQDTLQTRTRCPAVITHPVTGDRVFFNQVQLHHTSCLEPEAREDLLGVVGADRMPRHVCFGDGSPISDETMALIGRAYEECAVRFDWRRGDVVMLDNMLAAHARDPYEGPRKIVVAMGAMCDRAALSGPSPSQADARDDSLLAVES